MSTCASEGEAEIAGVEGAKLICDQVAYATQRGEMGTDDEGEAHALEVFANGTVMQNGIDADANQE